MRCVLSLNCHYSTLSYRPSQPVIPKRNDPDAYMAAEPTLSSLAVLAAETVDQDHTSSADSSQKTKEQIRRHYVRTLHKVIDESDIVILVLDARDPEGCRSRLVEEEVRRRESEGKKLIFVLNKIGVHVAFIRYSTIFLIVHRGRRSGLKRECSAVAPILATFHTDTSIPFCFL